MRGAPIAQWKHFRDWALTMMSCQLYASDQGLKKESESYSKTVHCLWMVAKYTRREKMRADIDLFGIFELINWMFAIVCSLHPHFRTQSPLRTHITRKKISEATQTAHKAGICPNRLWNLAVGGGERQEVDLPVLMKMFDDDTQYAAKIMKHGDYRDGLSQLVNTRDNHDLESPLDINKSRFSQGHTNCNAEVCCFSNIDSTRVKQLHKCSTEDCGEPLKFPSSEFDRPYQSFTWWLDDGEDVPKVTDDKRAYMAISHVWSDGTGGGVQGEGRVNRCLFNYFKGIAGELGCRAIWWDTISIPVKRAARQNAISRINENFQQAAHVIIHDQGLVQLSWTESSSCLALLLSTWFTRAWTTLELVMSRKERVSVIFRDPSDHSRHIIKNLDKDILARHPAYSSRGHWIASSIVSQLRERQFGSIGDIQKVLSTKSTSWPRDLMVIAGLLTGCKPNISLPGFIAHTTREIIIGLAEIEESFLYHGHATMAQEGGFSWCPFNLLDVRLRTDTSMFEKVFVDELGAVIGLWEYRELGEKDAKENIHPYSFHVSIDYQIRAALVEWENCLLLKHSHRDDTQALLVIPVDVGHCRIWDTDYVILDCLYVGTVYANLEWGPSYAASVRLGKSTGDPAANAQEVVNRYEDTKGPRTFGNPWARNLDSIRQSRKQSLHRS